VPFITFPFSKTMGSGALISFNALIDFPITLGLPPFAK
jgi:hypothetical protein